eukprot:m.451379 g.451379  ORF g.451379 m.451379 type:complete len:728 (+) comp21526_c0_seq1:396-2579(+)
MGTYRRPARLRAKLLSAAVVFLLYTTVRNFVGKPSAAGLTERSEDEIHGGGRTLLASAGEKPVWETCDYESDNTPVGWIILYILVVVHLFLGIAILCDDFFVPSLEAISEALQLSDDVAGATFMAAGSSAPELFTSLAGVVVDSDVGVGTIVGSAVFNILVIVTLSGAFAGQVLDVKWSCVVRDSAFYGSSIVLFILFAWDGYIEWWESFIFLAVYALYIVFMVYNEQLLAKLEAFVTGTDSSRVAPEKCDTTDVEAARRQLRGSNQPGELPASTDNADATGRVARATEPVVSLTLQAMEQKRQGSNDVLNTKISHVASSSNTSMARASSFDPADFRKLIEPATVKQARRGSVMVSPTVSGAAASSSSRNNLSSPIMRVLSASDSHLGTEVSEKGSDHKFRYSRVGQLSNVLRGGAKGSIKKSNRVHPQMSPSQVERTISESSTESASAQQLRVVDSQISRKSSPLAHAASADALCAKQSLDAPTPTAVAESTCGERCCTPCLYGEHPSGGVMEWTAFLLSAPYNWAFVNTIPLSYRPVPPGASDDTKQLGKYKLAFFSCILWIAALSFVMVTIIVRLGCLLGIDDYVMGLVFVAAGTSIPDALASILVAREGAGSMAVSNAIGSNVFDINLGIGLPFMIKALVQSKPVDLLSDEDRLAKGDNDEVIPHVKFGFILLGILCITLLGFKLNRFKLTKYFGGLLFSMYVIFITYAMVQELVCNRKGKEC